ncbi:hypothetical protein D3250_02820 [Nesterenkonia natronophila]|uniref:Uncharacterized protein n=1 Tax=Nesterenkonia natronophila TaxID=2174932 RepID=A0A3A4F4X8_9MICC|nr:hypothetical protein D3250_02820 [Nesterenkonia natronophila]
MWRNACAEIEPKFKRTPPHRPTTNGKAKRNHHAWETNRTQHLNLSDSILWSSSPRTDRVTTWTFDTWATAD